MPINRMSIKTNAKYSMHMAQPSPMLVALCFIVLSYLLTYLYNRVTGATETLQYYLDFINQAATSSWNSDIIYSYFHGYWVLISNLSLLAFLLSLLISAMRTLIDTGFIIYAMNVARTRPAGFGNLLDGFTIMLRIIVLRILESIFISLWSLLFVIPGIIATYRYRMSIYLLIDNPDMSPLECIRESKRMMRGRKSELFFLDMSFLGWSFLAGIPYLGYVASVWIAPYISITYVNYYDALRALESNSHFSAPSGDGYSEAPGYYRDPDRGKSRQSSPNSEAPDNREQFGGFSGGSGGGGGFPDPETPDDTDRDE